MNTTAENYATTNPRLPKLWLMPGDAYPVVKPTQNEEDLAELLALYLYLSSGRRQFVNWESVEAALGRLRAV